MKKYSNGCFVEMSESEIEAFMADVRRIEEIERLADKETSAEV